MNNSAVHLSVVHPGGVATNVANNSRVGAHMTDNQRRAEGLDRFKQMAITTPTAAAIRIMQGIEKNEPRILIGKDARRMDFLQRLKPRTYWASIARSIDKLARQKKSGDT